MTSFSAQQHLPHWRTWQYKIFRWKTCDSHMIWKTVLSGHMVWFSLFYVHRKPWKLNDWLGDKAGGTEGEWREGPEHGASCPSAPSFSSVLCSSAYFEPTTKSISPSPSPPTYQRSTQHLSKAHFVVPRAVFGMLEQHQTGPLATLVLVI